MSSVKIHKKKRKTRKSSSGIWRPYGVQKTPRHTQTSPAREERLAIRKKRVRLISLAIGAVLGLFTVGTIAFASHTPRFQIKNIQIEGNKVISERVLRATTEIVLYDAHLRLFSERSIFFFSKQSLQKMLTSRFPRLAQVQVSIPSYRDGLVRITVIERTPYAQWCRAYRQAGHESECFLLDELGFIFAPRRGDQPVRDEIFYGGLIQTNPTGVWFLPSYFSDVIRTVEAVERADVNISSVEIVNEQEYHAQIENGTLLLIRFDQDAQKVADNLKTALSSDALRDRLKEMEYIDLRFNSRVYYK